MRTENVEIFSDATNAAVMRHPSRAFPGILVQGDSLHIMCKEADRACQLVGQGAPGFEEVNDLRNTLWEYLNHYKVTLIKHSLKFPFSD